MTHMKHAYVIEYRTIQVVNTDPQRRCYHGCNAKEELVWGPWKALDWTSKERSEERLKFWQELNDYAVSQRGESAKSKFRLVETV